MQWFLEMKLHLPVMEALKLFSRRRCELAKAKLPEQADVIMDTNESQEK